jgi:membrane protein implicated in regulation of membrane protease activity
LGSIEYPVIVSGLGVLFVSVIILLILLIQKIRKNKKRKNEQQQLNQNISIIQQERKKRETVVIEGDMKSITSFDETNTNTTTLSTYQPGIHSSQINK